MIYSLTYDSTKPMHTDTGGLVEGAFYVRAEDPKNYTNGLDVGSIECQISTSPMQTNPQVKTFDSNGALLDELYKSTTSGSISNITYLMIKEDKTYDEWVKPILGIPLLFNVYATYNDPDNHPYFTFYGKVSSCEDSTHDVYDDDTKKTTNEPCWIFHVEPLTGIELFQD